eukprot:gene11790-13010_t
MASLVKSGVLVLTYLPRSVFLQKIIAEASKCVNNTLYIDLLTTSRTIPATLPKQTSLSSIIEPVINISDYYSFMSEVYTKVSQICTDIDVKVLLPPQNITGIYPRCTAKPIELCIGNTSSIRNLMEFEHIVSSRYEYCNGRFHLKYLQAVDELESMSSDESDDVAERTSESDSNETAAPVSSCKAYPGVVIGGTFDRMHCGHKLLIGAAALFATKKITVGIADGVLLKGKILEEIIEPVEARIENVRAVVDDLKPGLDKKIVAIEEAAGPSGTDDDLHLLVVSEETSKGGAYVNNVRKGNNLPPLDVHCIGMLNSDNSDLAKSLQQDPKVSSSAGRIRELGMLRRPPRILTRRTPYVIGLTGGIATGKSAVTRRLQRLGAFAINCDRLGHQAYVSGTKAYQELLAEFGDTILDDSGEINRRALGNLVFSDRRKLNQLNRIVWPEIRRMVDEKLCKMADDGIEVCIVEAAILFEAGWDELVNEVWVTTVPADEAVKRIVERDGFNETQARIRIEAQMTSRERISRSHVVISTLWEPEFTQKIVEKAWQGLSERANDSKQRFNFL